MLCMALAAQRIKESTTTSSLSDLEFITTVLAAVINSKEMVALEMSCSSIPFVRAAFLAELIASSISREVDPRILFREQKGG